MEFELSFPISRCGEVGVEGGWGVNVNVHERGLMEEKNEGLGIVDKFDVVRDAEGEW